MSTIIEKQISTSYHRKMKFNIESFSSADELTNTCATRELTSRSFDDMKTDTESESWTGVSSYEEALGYLRTGYQPIVDELKTSLKIAVKENGKRITFSNDIVGYTPVVPLAMKGVPECMINSRMKPIKCKVIDIYYDSTFTANVSKDNILETGSQLLKTIMDFESQGYRFNLYAVQCYCDHDGRTQDMLVVKVKSSGQPIDLKRISFPIVHPAFFRVIGFDWYSKVPNGKYRSCYGTSLQKVLMNRNEEIELSSKLFGDNALYISGQRLFQNGEEYLKEAITNAGNGKNR